MTGNTRFMWASWVKNPELNLLHATAVHFGRDHADPPPFPAPRQAGASASEEGHNKAASGKASRLPLWRLSGGCQFFGEEGSSRRRDDECRRASWEAGVVRSLHSDSSVRPPSGAADRRRSRRLIAQRGAAQMDRHGKTLFQVCGGEAAAQSRRRSRVKGGYSGRPVSAGKRG